jgi:hypothetical protein
MQKFCRFFKKGVVCKFGGDCKFAHAKAEEEEKEPAPWLHYLGSDGNQPNTPVVPKAKVVCSFFVSGSCWYGRACKFSHDKTGVDLIDIKAKQNASKAEAVKPEVALQAVSVADNPKTGGRPVPPSYPPPVPPVAGCTKRGRDRSGSMGRSKARRQVSSNPTSNGEAAQCATKVEVGKKIKVGKTRVKKQATLYDIPVLVHKRDEESGAYFVFHEDCGWSVWERKWQRTLQLARESGLGQDPAHSKLEVWTCSACKQAFVGKYADDASLSHYYSEHGTPGSSQPVKVGLSLSDRHAGVQVCFD